MTATCDAEIRVKDIGLISWPVCNTTVFEILQPTSISINPEYH